MLGVVYDIVYFVCNMFFGVLNFIKYKLGVAGYF